MFELTPFERRRRHMEPFNPFRELEEMEKNPESYKRYDSFSDVLKEVLEDA